MKDWTPAWKIAELKTVLETVEAIKANTANKENLRWKRKKVKNLFETR